MILNQIVRDFITENPDIKSKRGIAIELVRLYPEKFKSVEHARTHVREVTGSHGQRGRNNYSNPEMTKFFYNGFEKWAQENLNNELTPWSDPFVIPNSIKKLNVISDIHSVFLDKDVLNKFLKQTKDKTALLINGDLIDSESLSRHLKGHNFVSYDAELEICHQLLKGFKEEFDHVYFKEGNHDFWLERYLLTNAREIFRARGLQLKELLRCGELGVHHIHNLKYIQYGDLDILHGHEFSTSFGMGKFPSRGYVDRWQTFKKTYNVKLLTAHSHKVDISMSPKSKSGEFGICYVQPAMCKKSPAYNPYGGYENGWASLTNNDGAVEVVIHTA